MKLNPNEEIQIKNYLNAVFSEYEELTYEIVNQETQEIMNTHCLTCGQMSRILNDYFFNN